ncbi:MAG: hypothetical protein DRO98_06445 [Archaeoglobales archaeon]|nr:MAG: hypothetical protein DRO98_06445 [Archaeoglobales archaeon]
MLTPDVHEFSALFEFDSTFVANTVIAHIGKVKSEAKPKLGSVGLQRERQWYLELSEDLIVRLKPVYDAAVNAYGDGGEGGGGEGSEGSESEGEEGEDALLDEVGDDAFEERPSGFRHFFRGGVHLFYKHLGKSQYKAAISVYRPRKEGKTRIIVSSKGEFFKYERAEELFYELFKLLKEALSFFATRSGLRIDVSRAKLYPIRLELKVKYKEESEPRAVAVISPVKRVLAFRGAVCVLLAVRMADLKSCEDAPTHPVYKS